MRAHSFLKKKFSPPKLIFIIFSSNCWSHAEFDFLVRFLELKLEESITLDQFMDSYPVPSYEKSLDHLKKKFPVKCIPSEAHTILGLKRPQMQGYKKTAKSRIRCRLFLPMGIQVFVPAAARNESSAKLHKCALFGEDHSSVTCFGDVSHVLLPNVVVLV